MTNSFHVWSLALFVVTLSSTNCFADDKIPQTADSDGANQTAESWNITVDGKNVGTYHASLLGTPAIYPLRTPGGHEVTRNYPMTDPTELEKDDHPHHRSFWFNHGEVNGVDFWSLAKGSGRIKQTQATAQTSPDRTTIQSQNDWIDANGERLLQDERTFQFSKKYDDHIIDFSIRLIASDGAVTFGDTKEGSFGIRVAGPMKVDAKQGGKIVNAEGLENKAAWSQVSTWVNYSGPLAPDRDNQAGITIMYAPSNSIAECRWHVRTYGLFAANPFGRRHFGQTPYEGYQLEAGDHLDLGFRVVIHDGEFDREKTIKHYEDFAAQAMGVSDAAH